MAKVYGCPENIIIPDYFAFKDSSAYNKAVDDFKEELKIFCKENSKCVHAGEIISFPVGDGYAQYMVFNYTSLVHLSLGDSYQISDAHSRGLRKADIIQQVNFNKNKLSFSEIIHNKKLKK